MFSHPHPPDCPLAMMSQKRVAVLSAFMFQSQTRDIKIHGRYDSADTAGTVGVASFGPAPQLGLGRWGYVSIWIFIFHCTACQSVSPTLIGQKGIWHSAWVGKMLKHSDPNIPIQAARPNAAGRSVYSARSKSPSCICHQNARPPRPRGPFCHNVPPSGRSVGRSVRAVLGL